MLRAILAAIVGYVLLAVVLMVLLFGAYFAVGVERSFQPASYEPSTLWLALMFASGLVAAILGGFVATKIGGPRGVRIFLGLIVAMAALEVAMRIGKANEEPEVRGADVSAMDAAMKASPPLWVTLVNPVIGIAGVLVGARMAGKKAA
jgi:small-conductance mechanosensitive channel